MNGVHDMGGMHGMGPIKYERNEPVFHEAWEARIFALNRAMGAWRKWNLDAFRHTAELIPAPEYLRISYYERWLHSLVELMIKSGLVTRAEVENGKPASGSPWSRGNRGSAWRRSDSVIELGALKVVFPHVEIHGIVPRGLLPPQLPRGEPHRV